MTAFVALAILFVALFASLAEGAVFRVTVNGGNDPRDGSSWENALSLEDFRTVHSTTPDAEFWLARGAYAPGAVSDRNACFKLVSGTSIYGGFKGDETSLDQRDPQANLTVLTGDIDNNDTRDADGVTLVINGSNSYTVVLAEGADATAVLDGVVITGGDASGGNQYQSNGGGLICKDSKVTVRNCSFTANRAKERGGAVAIENDGPSFENSLFNRNSSGLQGGAVLVNKASPSFLNCTFRMNEAEASGGAIYNYEGSSPTVTGCTFFKNRSESNGGGIANVDGCHPLIVNCTFTQNEATSMGGGVYNSKFWGDPSNPSIINCTLTGNEVPGSMKGGGIYNDGANFAVITNCILWGNPGTDIVNGQGATPTVTYCVIGQGVSGNTIITEDPKLGPLADNGGPTLTHALGTGSSAIDSGTPATAPDVDQRGRPRPQGGGFDIGSYEADAAPGGGGGGGCDVSNVLPGAILLVLPLVLLVKKGS